jgi:hypothetical protein
MAPTQAQLHYATAERAAPDPDRRARGRAWRVVDSVARKYDAIGASGKSGESAGSEETRWLI